jgi:hypothetical protein
MKADHHFTVRPWHVLVLGSALGVTALFERLQGFRSGRQYVVCHHSSALDHLTVVALALVGGAFLTAVVGTVTATVINSSRTVFLVACMVSVLALVVAADRVDASGEQRAARMAAQRFSEDTCDYTPQIYTATPGWFSW